jgi:hypothetical protein
MWPPLFGCANFYSQGGFKKYIKPPHGNFFRYARFQFRIRRRHFDAAALQVLLQMRAVANPSANASSRSVDFCTGNDVMRITILNQIFGMFIAAAVFVFIPTPVRAAHSISRTEVPQIAIEASIHNCSLIATEMTLLETSNVAEAEGLRVPMNPLVNLPLYGAPSGGG